jgi:hypothetical protein
MPRATDVDRVRAAVSLRRMIAVRREREVAPAS